MPVSSVSGLAAAHLSFNSLVANEGGGWEERGRRLSRVCERTRGFGDFLSFMFLADGAVEEIRSRAGGGGLEAAFSALTSKADHAGLAEELVALLDEGGSGRDCGASPSGRPDP